MKYYIIKLLTNTAGQDGSKIEAVYQNDNPNIALEKALVGYHSLCATLHNAQDVRYAIAQMVNENGNVEIMEKINHIPIPVPDETPEFGTEE